MQNPIVGKSETAQMESPHLAHYARLVAEQRDLIAKFRAGVEQMLAHEQAGGDGWWKGWEMIKAAHRKAHNVD